MCGCVSFDDDKSITHISTLDKEKICLQTDRIPNERNCGENFSFSFFFCIWIEMWKKKKQNSFRYVFNRNLFIFGVVMLCNGIFSYFFVLLSIDFNQIVSYNGSEKRNPIKAKQRVKKKKKKQFFSPLFRRVNYCLLFRMNRMKIYVWNSKNDVCIRIKKIDLNVFLCKEIKMPQYSSWSKILRILINFFIKLTSNLQPNILKTVFVC